MNIDAAGVRLIAQHEGVRLRAYQDSGGIWTIGYGHTATARPGMKITMQRAVELLQQDLARFEACVEDAVTRPLEQAQFNALVSLAYNRGCAGFRRSSVVELVNAGAFDAAATAWLTTATTVNGKSLRGLVKRRKNEAAMFASVQPQDQGASSLASWLFSGSLKALIGRI